jgi:hypothetical protein
MLAGLRTRPVTLRFNRRALEKSSASGVRPATLGQGVEFQQLFDQRL